MFRSLLAFVTLFGFSALAQIAPSKFTFSQTSYVSLCNLTPTSFGCEAGAVTSKDVTIEVNNCDATVCMGSWQESIERDGHVFNSEVYVVAFADSSKYVFSSVRAVDTEKSEASEAANHLTGNPTLTDTLIIRTGERFVTAVDENNRSYYQGVLMIGAPYAP